MANQFTLSSPTQNGRSLKLLSQRSAKSCNQLDQINSKQEELST